MQTIFWVLENGSNFAVHMAFLAAVFFVAFWLLSQRGVAVVCLLACLLALVPFLAGLRYAQPVLACEGENPLRIASFNVLFENRETERVLAGIRDLRPDIVVLQETTGHWPKALEPLKADYPHTVLAAGGSLRILSRRPLVITDRPFGDGKAGRLVKVAFEHGGVPVTLYGVHLTKPTSGAALAKRNRELDTLTAEIRVNDGPVIVAGDFNATPLSSVFQRFLENAGLLRPRGGAGALRTWPSAWPFLGIQIDHVLTNDDFQIVHAQAGPDFGSNHLPILADLVLAADPGGDCVGASL